MLKQMRRIVYNGLRFIGKKNYKNILLVDPSFMIVLGKKSRLSIGKKFRTRRNVEINVRNDADLLIGDQVFFNSNCVITCRERIVIGDNTVIGPGVVIFDHDHKLVSGKVQENLFLTAPTIIGKNVWIGAGSMILRGAVIGDGCIIGAGSIIKDTVMEHTMLIQKRENTYRPLEKREEIIREGEVSL